MSTTPDATTTAPDAVPNAAVRAGASLVAAVDAAQTTYRTYETRAIGGGTGWDTPTAEAELAATAELARLYSALSNEVPEPFATALRHARNHLEQHGMELDEALAEDFDGNLPDARGLATYTAPDRAPRARHHGGQPVVIDTDVAPRFHIAILDTSNFEFMAGGATAEQARATLRRAWETHAAQTGASYSWEDLSDDVTVVALRAGDALRDKSPIILAGDAHESS